MISFAELGLIPDTLATVQELGFETPTPIQAEVIPHLLKGGRDLVGRASTGTGKTAAFGLPLIERVDPAIEAPQAMVLAPTRELSLQIADDLKKFSAHKKGLRIAVVYGGANISAQITVLNRGAQIVVATPGRLLDLIERRVARLEQISALVLDEADEILNMGFKEEIDAILSKVPQKRLTWLFSATMTKGVARTASKYLNDPIEISVGRRNESPANIDHCCFMVHEKDRFEALKRVLDNLPDIYGLVFCRTRVETQAVAEKLMAGRYAAESLHGDLSQTQRDAVMRKFRRKNIRILVATDVAARGIDVDDISHVIHYKLPDEVKAYTHRSGRTARAGKSGFSIALINMHERRLIRELERRNSITIRLDKLPDARAICENQLLALINRVVECPVNEEEIRDYLPPAYEALCNLDRKEIIKRFVATEFNHFLNDYRNARDLTVKPGEKHERRPPQPSGSTRRRTRHMPTYDARRFSINVGRVHQVNAGAIVRLVCEKCNVMSNQIGAIRLGREESTFEVSKEIASAVRDGMPDVKLDGRKVSVCSAGSRPLRNRRRLRRKIE